jgi:hypothetical protein
VVTGYTEALYHASVPNGVRMPDGSIGVYYVNGEASGVYLGRLTGSTITPVGPITVDGFVRPNGVVDPDAYVVDGKIRLAYLAGFGTNLTAPRAMCIAESTDGLTFHHPVRSMDARIRLAGHRPVGDSAARWIVADGDFGWSTVDANRPVEQRADVHAVRQHLRRRRA